MKSHPTKGPENITFSGYGLFILHTMNFEKEHSKYLKYLEMQRPGRIFPIHFPGIL